MTTSITSQDLQEKFQAVFGEKADHTFFSPGRINLIGEHTDYNGGHVFPAAITLGTYGQQESAKTRSCVSSQAILKTRGSLKSHWRIFILKKSTTGPTIQKACSISYKKLVISLIAGWMSMFTEIFQMDLASPLQLPLSS